MMNGICYKRQQGVVLIAALAVLILLTILAVGAFQASRQEESISANHMWHSMAFQMAETGIDDLLNNTNNFSTALASDITVNPVLNDVDYSHSVTASMTHEATGIVPGWSAGATGSINWVMYKYNLHGEGILLQADGATAAQSVIDQGAYHIAPKY